MDKKDELFIEETIIKVCSEVDVDPDADLFEGSEPGEGGFSLTYTELLKIILIQNWSPEYSQYYSKYAISSEGLRRFLRGAKIKSGLISSYRLEGYLNTARKFFKYRIFISEPPEALLLLKEIEFQSGLDTPLLISGEPGTGKKVIAKIIHEGSPRKQKQFKVIKCYNLSDELQYGEIFGYEKGVFTGAITDYCGTVSECDGGTVYIDEILCLGPKTQIALSTLLGENKYKRLGSSEYLAANCRIIFGTKGWDNNISDAVRSGKYSYLRNQLSLPIRTFPLRFGRVNIPLIIYLYTIRLAKDNVYFPDYLIKVWLTTNPFPGNYKQLIGEIEYYVSKYIVWHKKESKANEKRKTSIKQRKGYLYSELFQLAFRDENIKYIPRPSAIEKESDRKIISLSDIVYDPILRFALKYKDENGKTQFDLGLYENISTPSIFTKYTELLETYDKIKSGELDINIDINSKDPYLNPFLGMEDFLDWLRNDKKDFLYDENEEDIQQNFPAEEYNRIEATIEIDDYNNEYAKKEFVLIPKSKDVPKITIKDFSNTHTREFTFLLFLIYEREQGGKDWLSKILDKTAKFEREKLNEVMSWCDLPISIKDIDKRWEKIDSRRFDKNVINKKAQKSGLSGELILSTGKYNKDKYGQYILIKKFGRSIGTYMLNPGLQAHINKPPK